VISGPRPQFFNRGIGNRRELTGTINYGEIDTLADEEWNINLTYIEDWDKLFPYLFSADNIIEYNEIHDVMQVLDDGNAIYLSGTGHNNIIRKNYVHHNTSPHRQGGIRADDYARDITISGNIIYKFAIYGIDTKYDSYISNNYIIDYVPTERVNGEKFRQLSFFYISACGPIKGCIGKKNIYYQSAGETLPFIKTNFSRSILKTLPEFPRLSDCQIDSNIYYGPDIYKSSLDQLEGLRSRGVDSNSIVADPLFEGLEEAGFKLKDNSPALKLGIKQIDFENIGLLKKQDTLL
jgi:hypothetical protein